MLCHIVFTLVKIFPKVKTKVTTFKLRYMEKSSDSEITLKDLIAQANTTQRELSKKTGISEATINTWVAKRKVPRLDNALVVARALGVSLKTLSKSMGLTVDDIPDDSNSSNNN